MRALVTGSEGFIGKNLVAALRERGDSVSPWDTKRGYDLFDIYKLPLGDIDVIYHLACINQEVSEEKPLRSRFVNAYGALFMAELAKSKNAKLIYTSTASVYGGKRVLPIKSDGATFPETVYAKDKLKGEQYALDYENSVVLRLSNVYGPHQTVDNPYCGVIGKFIDSALKNEPLKVIGDGLQTRDFTYVDDVVGLLISYAFFEKLDHFGPWNVSRGREVRILDLADLVQGAVGKYPGVEFIPKRSVDGIDRRVLQSDIYCPTDLLAGLERTINWYRGRLESS